MYYTFKSNKIYPVIKAGKQYFKKMDHFAPVSPTYVGACMGYICVGVGGVCLPVSAHDNVPPVYEKI